MATANFGGKKLEVVDKHAGQFQYLGRWVDKEHFRTFVYDGNGNQKLANSYQEFDDLISSGIWFAARKETHHKRKPKDGTLRADG